MKTTEKNVQKNFSVFLGEVGGNIYIINGNKKAAGFLPCRRKL
jgi:hypothetical protein